MQHLCLIKGKITIEVITAILFTTKLINAKATPILKLLIENNIIYSSCLDDKVFQTSHYLLILTV